MNRNGTSPRGPMHHEIRQSIEALQLQYRRTFLVVVALGAVNVLLLLWVVFLDGGLEALLQ